MSAALAFWRRWRFHLSALAVLVPVGFAPDYFQRLAMDAGSVGLGARVIGVHAVGDWTVKLAEFDLGPPAIEGEAGPVKLFTLALDGPARDEVKAAYIKIGKPRSIRSAGALFAGTPYRQTAGLQVPPTATAASEVWLTLEGWDGSVSQSMLPLSEASPATADWLRRAGT
ncbi:MAG: thiamine pyrophosphate-binding protein [Hansschlegelia sp.]